MRSTISTNVTMASIHIASNALILPEVFLCLSMILWRFDIGLEVHRPLNKVYQLYCHNMRLLFLFSVFLVLIEDWCYQTNSYPRRSISSIIEYDSKRAYSYYCESIPRFYCSCIQFSFI